MKKICKMVFLALISIMMSMGALLVHAQDFSDVEVKVHPVAGRVYYLDGLGVPHYENTVNEDVS